MSGYRVGDTIAGKFIVTSTAQGGMGSVAFCLDMTTMQQVVLKSYLDGPTHSGLRERFLLEAQNWVRLGRHANVLQALEALEWRGRYFVVAEYVPCDESGRTTLEQYMDWAELPGSLLLDWLVDVCSGMEYAHTKGIKCHRDLKPANLFVTPEGRLKIGDWGLARAVDLEQGSSFARETGDARLTQVGAVLGTPLYMAPECWRDARFADERSDVYALGVILYQLVAGRPPFSGTMASLADAHETQSPPILDSPFWPLMERCLAKRPDERPATFNHLRGELLKEKFGEAIREAEEADVDWWSFTVRMEEPTDASDIGEKFNQALSLKRLGRYDEALTRYRSVLSMLGKSGDSEPSRWALVYSNMSSAYLAAGDPSQADRCADVALSYDRSLATAWTNKGVAQGDLGDFQKSRLYHEAALDLDTQAIESWNGLGCVLVDHFGEYEAAVECCLEALRLSEGGHVAAWINLGNAYYHLGRFEEAGSSYWDAYQIGGVDALHALANRTAAALSNQDAVTARETVREMRRVAADHPLTRQAERDRLRWELEYADRTDPLRE